MNRSRRMRWEGHVARMEAKVSALRIFVRRPDGKKLLERQKRRWLDNIKMNVREIVWNGMDGIDLAQDRDQWTAVVNTVLRVP
jgi:hypothetical protein